MIKFKNNSPIVVLIGKSAVGKDTIKNELLINLNCHNSISYTTRPKRNGEENGKEYFFVSKKEFDILKNNNQILEHTEYNVCGSLFEYGLGNDSFVNDKINVVIVNPIGLKQLIKHEQIKNRLFIVQMTLPDDEIKRRYFEREKQEDIKNLNKRFEARKLRDEEDFKDLNEIILENNLNNCEISNYNTKDTVKKLINYIYKNYLLNHNLIIDNMDNEYQYKNKEGKIEKIDDMNQLHGSWGGLAIIPEIDEVTITDA